jgi:hypothetical protein
MDCIRVKYVPEWLDRLGPMRLVIRQRDLQYVDLGLDRCPVGLISRERPGGSSSETCSTCADEGQTRGSEDVKLSEDIRGVSGGSAR